VVGAVLGPREAHEAARVYRSSTHWRGGSMAAGAVCAAISHASDRASRQRVRNLRA